MRARLLAATLVATFLCTAPAWGAGSDTFAGAGLLPYGTADSTSNAAATIEQGETLTAGGDSADRTHCVYGNNTRSQAQRTLWWAIVGTGRPVTVSTIGSSFDTHLGIFDGPINDNSVSCTDTNPNEMFQFNSVAGTVYHLQVGGCVQDPALLPCGTTSGEVQILATSSAAANDNAGNAAPLATAQPVNGDNLAATEEAGESLSCGGQPLGRTVWYHWHSSGRGTAVFTATPFASIAVHPLGGGAPLACDAAPDGQARAALSVVAGDYLVQVGGTGAHAGLASDSLQGLFTVRADFTAAPPVDNRIKSRVSASYLFFGGYTKITALRALNVPAGAKVEVTCSGASCPFRRRPSRTVRRFAPIVRLTTRALRAAQIRPVTTFRIKITARGKVGRLISIRFSRIGRAPTQRTRCISPAGRIGRC